MTEEDATALAMVRLGYALDDPTECKRCLTFRAAFATHAGAYAALRAIGGYNDFQPKRVIDALRAAELDAYSRIMIGREYSVVLYVSGAYGDDRDKVLNALRKAGAAECDLTANGDVRAWWD